MKNDKRLIEVAFPLKQTSIDSVHEKNVRHGHISTLHIWPARRPLAASRAALIATLLPDPGDKDKRDELLKRLGGTLNKTLKKKKMPSGRIEAGGARLARTWSGSGTRSGVSTAAVSPRYSTRSLAAAPFRWKLCAWAAT